MRSQATIDAHAAYRVVSNAATEAARGAIRPGDRVSRLRCGGLKSTFTFTHWDGEWLCGRAVTDCAACCVYAVNGEPRTFGDHAAIEIAGKALGAALSADRAAWRAERERAGLPLREPAGDEEIPF